MDISHYQGNVNWNQVGNGRIRFSITRASHGYEVDTEYEDNRLGAAANDVYFDMEGHPLPDGQLEYLFGAVHCETGAVRFRDIWALRREEERAAFETFVDWVHARWRQDPTLHVYHYNSYEVAALQRLMGAYGSREVEGGAGAGHRFVPDGSAAHGFPK